MLVTLKEILTKAKQENYAVPACNIDNEHNLRAAIEAAEEMNTGIILNTTPGCQSGSGKLWTNCSGFCQTLLSKDCSESGSWQNLWRLSAWHSRRLYLHHDRPFLTAV